MPHTQLPARVRILVAAGASVALLGLGSGAVFAGEITGNGDLKEVKGRSACAYSGQEDLQWYFDDDNEFPRPEPIKGEPGHAQSWGQVPKVVRDTVLIPMGLHPGQACNPNGGGGEP